MQTLKPLTLAILAGLSAAVLADDSSLQISGFGSVGMTRTNTDDAQYRAGFLQPSGADKRTTHSVDSKLAVQLAGKLTSDLSATAQIVSQYGGDSSYRPKLEWAFAKYDFSGDVGIRVGRIGMPVFLISDFRNVGYANVWARPPVEVYAQVPFSSFDGADLLWRHAFGDNTLTVQPYLGRSKIKLADQLTAVGDEFMGVNSTFEMGSLQLRAGYTQTKLTLDSPRLLGLLGGMRKIGAVLPGWTAAADAMQANKKDASFLGLGALWDDGKLVVQSEYTQRRTESYVEDTNAWYGTVGYRFGDFTPYLSYANISTNHDDVADKLVAPPLQAPCVGAAAAQVRCIKAAAQSVMSGSDQSTTSVGVRWNAYKNIALKAQFDQVKPEAGKDNWFYTQDWRPGVQGKTVNVYSVVADFVF